MRNVIGIDPGLATFGVVIMASNGIERHIRHVDVFTSEGRDDSWGWRMTDDLTRRTRELARWLHGKIDHWQPRAAFAEALPIFNSVKPQVYVSLGWGVVCSVLERHAIPLSSVPPNTWRTAVCGKRDEAMAHAVAMAENPKYRQLESATVEPHDKAHCRDALGVLAWADRAGLIKAAVLR